MASRAATDSALPLRNASSTVRMTRLGSRPTFIIFGRAAARLSLRAMAKRCHTASSVSFGFSATSMRNCFRASAKRSA